MKLALDYLRSDSTTEWQTNAQAAWEYGYGEYDPAAKRTKIFAPMGNFANNAPGSRAAKRRTRDLRGLSLDADGGMPAKDFAVIRRWIAPRDGYISIDGHARAFRQGRRWRAGNDCFQPPRRELGSWVAVQPDDAHQTAPRPRQARRDD